MLRRRPVPLYELLSEDELLAAGTGRVDGPRAPEPLASALGAGGRRGEAARTLAVALAAAVLVGFAVWELLGLAHDQPAERTAIPAAALPRPGRVGARPPARTGTGSEAVAFDPSTLPRRGGRVAAASRQSASPVRATAPAPMPVPVPAPHAPLPASSAQPLPASPPPASAPALAQQEFGFER